MLITNVMLDGKPSYIRIENGIFTEIKPMPNEDTAAHEAHPHQCSADAIDAGGMYAFPAFYNTHTHAAMTLLRGYADDLPLMEWLQEHIWVAEANLTTEDIQRGVRLACEEMIRSGTVGFVDMYMQQEAALPVVEEMGLRAILGVNFFDGMSDEERLYNLFLLESHGNGSAAQSSKVQLAVAPHAIYTVSGDNYRKYAGLARKLNMKLITHVSETRGEVEASMKEHGMSPVEYLNSLGVLGDNLIAAHCVHLSDNDIALLAEHKVAVSHCPVSNLKLASGIARTRDMINKGCRLTLGTDGAASNNNLDMREEMKFASLLAKAGGDPTAIPAADALRIATRAGAQAMGVNGGAIEVGCVADMLLVNMNYPATTPIHSAVSNWVYAADSHQIDTVICEGRILMQSGIIRNSH